MKLERCLLILLFVFIWSFQALAEGESSGYWVGVFPVYQLSQTQSLSLQAEFRRLGPQSLGLFRPSYHWKQSSFFVLGGGYDYFALNQPEHRIWPEISGMLKIFNTKGFFDWRLRQEIRLKGGKSQVGSRSRLLVGFHQNLTESGKIKLFVFNEAFWQQCGFQNCISQFDRNWLGGRVRVEATEFYYDMGGFWESVSANKTSGLITAFSLGRHF